MSGEMTAWGIEWNGRLYWHTDLSRYGHFALFRTRREARQAIEADWSFLRERPDLRTEPHRWRMPRAVRVSVEVVR